VEPIASFRNPPVAEVVTAVKFAPMSSQSFFGLSQLWSEHWSSAFPSIEFQPPYGAPVESFDQAPRPAFQFELQQGMVLPRVWASSDDGTQLVQIQHDWFAANWRRDAVPDGVVPHPATYDRWPARRKAFITNWQKLSAWLVSHGEAVIPTQCEVTYINHVRPIDGLWATHDEAGRLFNGIGLPTPAQGMSPELFNWRGQYLLRDADGSSVSRLHAGISAGYGGPGPEPVPLMLFELTVRGTPSGDDLLTFFDRGRQAIVETFVQLTSPEAREAWGQE
jgi:uncharacterized protein (TIGR04255 family)